MSSTGQIKVFNIQAVADVGYMQMIDNMGDSIKWLPTASIDSTIQDMLPFIIASGHKLYTRLLYIYL